jgi:hypothetical protein
MMGDNRGDSDDSRYWDPYPPDGASGRPSPPTSPPTASGSSEQPPTVRLASRPKGGKRIGPKFFVVALDFKRLRSGLMLV